MLLFLIGMPGAGKTYFGKRAAEAFDLRFIDLDDYIMVEEQCTISALFALYGENGFREKERHSLQRIIETDTGNCIVSCGGGTPCFHSNMELMLGSGKVIYLRAGINYLLANLMKEPSVRPLLNSQEDIAGYLAQLLEGRKSFYEQADYILQAEDISLITFGEIISSCINRQ